MKGAMTFSSPSGITKKWWVPTVSKLSFYLGPGRMPGWGPVGLGVCFSASASITLASNMLVSACWYRTMAMGEMGEGEQDGTSLMNAGMMGKV